MSDLAETTTVLAIRMDPDLRTQIKIAADTAGEKESIYARDLLRANVGVAAIPLNLDDVIVDNALNPREGALDQDVIEDYAQHIDELPPMTAAHFQGEEMLHLVKGFHRYAAHRRAQRESGRFIILDNLLDRSAGRLEAGLDNLRNGLRLTRREHRGVIGDALRLHPSWSNVRLAELCHTTDKTVASVREELEARGEIEVMEMLEDAAGVMRPRSVAKADLCEGCGKDLTKTIRAQGRPYCGDCWRTRMTDTLDCPECRAQNMVEKALADDKVHACWSCKTGSAKSVWIQFSEFKSQAQSRYEADACPRCGESTVRYSTVEAWAFHCDSCEWSWSDLATFRFEVRAKRADLENSEEADLPTVSYDDIWNSGPIGSAADDPAQRLARAAVSDGPDYYDIACPVCDKARLRNGGSRDGLTILCDSCGNSWTRIEAVVQARNEKWQRATVEAMGHEPIDDPVLDLICPECGNRKLREAGAGAILCGGCGEAWASVESVRAALGDVEEQGSRGAGEQATDDRPPYAVERRTVDRQLLERARAISSASNLSNNRIRGLIEIDGRNYVCTGNSADWCELQELVSPDQWQGQTYTYNDLANVPRRGDGFYVGLQASCRGTPWVLTERRLILETETPASEPAPADDGGERDYAPVMAPVNSDLDASGFVAKHPAPGSRIIIEAEAEPLPTPAGQLGWFLSIQIEAGGACKLAIAELGGLPVGRAAVDFAGLAGMVHALLLTHVPAAQLARWTGREE